MRMIKAAVVIAYLCTQGWFPLLVGFEYFLRDGGIPVVTLATIAFFAWMQMTLRDANGELLFQEKRGLRIGWFTFFGFDILKYLKL